MRLPPKSICLPLPGALSWDDTMSSRHVSTPTPVGALLPAAFPPLADRLLALAVRRDWEGLVGPQISRRAQPAGVMAGTLTVVVDNSAWLQEMTLRGGELLARLQGRYGPEAIRDVRFTLGTPAPEPEVIHRRASRTGNALTEEEEAWVASAAASVQDPALAETIRRLLTKDALSRRPGGGRP